MELDAFMIRLRDHLEHHPARDPIIEAIVSLKCISLQCGFTISLCDSATYLKDNNDLLKSFLRDDRPSLSDGFYDFFGRLLDPEIASRLDLDSQHFQRPISGFSFNFVRKESLIRVSNDVATPLRYIQRTSIYVYQSALLGVPESSLWRSPVDTTLAGMNKLSEMPQVQSSKLDLAREASTTQLCHPEFLSAHGSDTCFADRSLECLGRTAPWKDFPWSPYSPFSKRLWLVFDRGKI